MEICIRAREKNQSAFWVFQNKRNPAKVIRSHSVMYSSFTKIRPQAKIDNFAFKNSNIIIEGLI